MGAGSRRLHADDEYVPSPLVVDRNAIAAAGSHCADTNRGSSMRSPTHDDPAHWGSRTNTRDTLVAHSAMPPQQPQIPYRVSDFMYYKDDGGDGNIIDECAPLPRSPALLHEPIFSPKPEISRPTAEAEEQLDDADASRPIAGVDLFNPVVHF